MINFNEFISETSTLHVFDVDDTLVHSNAKVHVKNSEGKLVKRKNFDLFLEMMNEKKYEKLFI